MYSIDEGELFLGLPYQMENGILVYQPTIDDIYKKIKIKKYNFYLSILTMDEQDLAEIAKMKGIKEEIDLSVFQYILLSAHYDKEFFVNLKSAFTTFLKKDIMISVEDQLIIVGKPTERLVIDAKNFPEFQYAIRRFNSMRVAEDPPENETPMQKRFRLKREMRERIKEKTALKNNKGGTFADTMSAVIAAKVGITLENIGGKTLYQIRNLLDRSLAQEKYNNEMVFLAAGADSKKIKIVHWTENLNKEDK